MGKLQKEKVWENTRMQEFIIVTGIILKTVPIGEYDRRVVILSKERGKISAFAKGARRQNSRLMAASNPFSFGEFKLYEGRTSYNIMEANIMNYFEELRNDFIGAYYGMYFLEVADYYTRENNDEKEMLKLLYQSLRALLCQGIGRELVQAVFELKSIVINGEYPGVPTDKEYEESTVYALNYIEKSSIEKLYTFTVNESVLKELKEISGKYRRRFMEKEFKSLEILESLS